MNVIAWYMRRQQTPATIPTHLLNRLQYRATPRLVQVLGSLIHLVCRGCGALGVHCQIRGSSDIVFAINDARFAALEMTSIAGKGNQVNHGP